MEEYRILTVGDSAISVEFGDVISPDIYQKVDRLKKQVEAARINGIIEIVPTYRSLMIHYDPMIILYGELCREINNLHGVSDTESSSAKKIITLPVLFGGETGPDLLHMAEYHKTSPEHIVELFCKGEFLIYMLGFAPGFPYIGGAPKELETPRLDTPRTKNPAGSVGIGGAQLGIYPVVSPGGYCIAGITPVKLFDERHEDPVLLEAGEWIRFREIDSREYDRICEEVEKDIYIPEIEVL